MADTLTTLAIKDGTGASKTVSAVTSSNGIITYHALTGTIAADISSSLNYNNTSSANYLSDVSSSLSSIKTNISNLLNGTVISASVDIVTGDTNLITGSIKELSSSLNYSSKSATQYLYEISSSINSLTSYDKISTSATTTTINYGGVRNGNYYTASADATRNSLIIYNNTDSAIDIAIGDTSMNYNQANLYGVQGAAFVLQPSASYFSEKSYAGLKHWISSSYAATYGAVLVTKIN